MEKVGIAVGIVLLIWTLDCWYRPYVDCLICGGNKKDYDADHEHLRLTFCTWCLNTGLRLRWELRLLNVIR